jgi:hypothetical protein
MCSTERRREAMDERAWEAEFERVLVIIRRLGDEAGVEPETVAAEMVDRLSAGAMVGEGN